MFFKRLKKPDPEAEKKLRDEIENYGGLEKNDLPAMIFAAYLTILPVALAVLLLFTLIAFLLI